MRLISKRRWREMKYIGEYSKIGRTRNKLRIIGFGDFDHQPVFRKLGLLPSSDEGGGHCVGSLKASLNDPSF
jgi:hypothetical protein